MPPRAEMRRPPRLAAAWLALLFVVCGPEGIDRDGGSQAGGPDPARDEVAEQGEVAVIRMDLGGEIWIRFFPGAAPRHVKSFKQLGREGFYDGTTFHRVIPGFMIQGGDALSKDDNPANDGLGNPGFYLEAEFNSIPHRRGTVAMARRAGPDTAGSQFYIVVQDNAQWSKVLDGRYTVFGEVIGGMEVVDRIVAAARDPRDRPLEDQRIAALRILPAPESAAEE